MSVRLNSERRMSLEWRARSGSLAWSNPLAWWWGLLTVVSAANIAAWFLLYRKLHDDQPAASLGASSDTGLMLLLCAAYVFGCAFRSFLPRADVQRICLFDTFLSSVLIGRSVATVAEICFAVQWVIILRQLGGIAGADTTVNVALLILPLIVLAECCSWHAVLTTNFLGNAIENSIWAIAFLAIGIGLCRLLPEFNGPVRWALILAISGIASYLAFLMIVDVPMYLGRWRAGLADGSKLLGHLEGLRDVSTRWIVTHDLAHWKDEIAWMSLYFSLAVWASAALGHSRITLTQAARRSVGWAKRSVPTEIVQARVVGTARARLCLTLQLDQESAARMPPGLNRNPAIPAPISGAMMNSHTCPSAPGLVHTPTMAGP